MKLKKTIRGLRNVARFATDQLGYLRELADKGDFIKLSMLGKPWFLVSHPDDIETVIVKHARVMGRDQYVDVLRRTLGHGLLTSEGDLWKRQRRLMSQAFVPKRIHGYGAAMVRVTEAGLQGWRDALEINIHDQMSRLTMEVVTDVLFGASVSPDDVVEVREAIETINEFYANSPEAITRLPPWVPTPRNLRMGRAIQRVDALMHQIISRRRAGERRDDLLGVLLAARDDDGSGMSDQQLRDETITLFLAGHETTALTLAHTLYLLSKHPDVDRKVHAELASVLRGRAPSADDVRSLVYLDRVIKESMRLYPPAWTTGREALEDIELRGHTIPKGSQLLMSQWVVHRDARFFPNPEGFDPERWSPERVAQLPKFAYFPFGGGPRVCIGNHFAMMEAALMLATILQRYRIELLPGQRLELKPSVTLRQRGPGLRARVFERAHQPAATATAA
jgi:cytochrome P450